MAFMLGWGKAMSKKDIAMRLGGGNQFLPGAVCVWHPQRIKRNSR